MEVIVANLQHVHPKIDFLKLQTESISTELNFHFYLLPGEQISPSEISECKSQLENLAPLSVKVFAGDEDFNSLASNASSIGVILESIVSFETSFLEKLVLVFRETEAFCLYSDFNNSSQDIVHEQKLPAWSPIRFESVDYLGSVLAFDLEVFTRSNVGVEVSRNTVIDFAQANKLKISRIPSALYTCNPDLKRNQAIARNLAVPDSVSIVIPTQGLTSANDSLLENCVLGLVKQVGISRIELVIVADEGYDQGVVSRVKEMLPKNFTFKLIEFNETFNFSRKCNLGASQSTGQVIVFLNDDVELVSSDGISQLSRWSLLERVGAVGSQLQFPDGSIQHAGITLLDVKPRNSYLDQFPRVTGLGDLEVPHEVTGVTGACLAITRDKFHSSGGWNEELPNSYNDVDLCLRLNNMGFQSVVLNHLKIIHNESSSRDAEFDLKAFETLKKLWLSELSAERFLRSAEANGIYAGPWGSNHNDRLDFSGNSFSYARHLISSHGFKKLLSAVFGRLTGKTSRLLSIGHSEYL
jgi:GT2 family glycosyltransferase